MYFNNFIDSVLQILIVIFPFVILNILYQKYNIYRVKS